MKRQFLFVLFLITSLYNSTIAQNIIGAEYFIDSDPGVGMGSYIPIASAANVDMPITIGLNNVTAGAHKLGWRVKNNLGKWSHYESRLFYVFPIQNNVVEPQIVSGEWFVDTDPGISNGTSFSVEAGTNIDITMDLTLLGLPVGNHQLHVRVKDANGKWTHYEGRTITIDTCIPITETCNGVDEDCDGTIDDGLTFVNYYNDVDGDGFGAGTANNACESPGATYVTNNTDCNDNNVALYNGTAEVCNNLDDDCNGAIDNGLSFVNYYNDTDGDGYGSGTATNACQSPGATYVTNNTDCLPTNAGAYPGALEICGNAIDEDCNDYDLTCGGAGPENAVAVLSIGQFGTGVQANTTVNFGTAVSTSQSPGSGLDKWYQFTAVTNAVRIGYKGSTSVDDDNRLMLFNGGQPMNSTWVPLTTEDNVHPGALGASTDGGNETILYDDLVVGNQYFVCVQNTNTTAGTGSMTVSWLYGSKGDIGPYTNYTYTYNNTCQNFKAQFRPNGKFYTVKRWASAAVTGVPDWTYTIPTMNSTVCQLGKILSPNLTSTPQQKYVTVDVLYQLPNAYGTIVEVNATGTIISTIGLNGEGALLVRSSDACPIYKSTTGTIATNRSVCGTSYYNWRFDLVYPTTGLPISINGAMGASRIMPMANVSGIANGQRYDVQIKPVHIDNLNQTGYSGISCVRTLGAAGMVAEETFTTTEGAQGHWTIYPNPNRGEGVALMLDGMDGKVELELMDATGRLLEKTTWNVEDSTQREWSFTTPLNSGLYEIRIQQGMMRETLRMVVVR